MAGSAELSRSLFVSRSSDVIGMERDLCGAWLRAVDRESRTGTFFDSFSLDFHWILSVQIFDIV